VARPLTDAEVESCRTVASGTLYTDRLSLVWALLEACATSLELRAVRACDVDLDARRVWLHGGLKGWPRWTSLTGWSATRLAEAVADAKSPDEELLRVTGMTDHSVRMAVSNAATTVLRRAGLLARDGVRARSVTAWAGRRVLVQTGSIAEVARQLGLRSLDNAATAIGYDWLTEGIV
jgi:integrase